MVTKERKLRRIRITPSPCCPIHGAPMIAKTIMGGMRRWYCPMPDCCESMKQPASVVLFEYVESEEVDDE